MDLDTPMNATMIRRPAGLLTRAQVDASAWRRAFGSVDAVPNCSCCGAGLTRRAVQVDDGRTLGVDCAVAAGVISARAVKPQEAPVVRASDLARIDAHPAAWAALCGALGPAWQVEPMNDAGAAAWVAAGGPARLAGAMVRLAWSLA